MSAQFSFRRRLALVLIPTPSQVVACALVAIVVILGAHAQRVLALIGINNMALSVTRVAVHGRFETILNSPISQTVALITFWSGVGVVTYLICWFGLSLFNQAHNELTLTTEYTNRGHGRGPYDALILKTIGAAALIAAVALLKPGLALWLAMAGAFLATPTAIDGLYSIFAALGLAAQIYLVLACALATFTPWYKAEAFTDE